MATFREKHICQNQFYIKLAFEKISVFNAKNELLFSHAYKNYIHAEAVFEAIKSRKTLVYYCPIVLKVI